MNGGGDEPNEGLLEGADEEDAEDEQGERRGGMPGTVYLIRRDPYTVPRILRILPRIPNSPEVLPDAINVGYHEHRFELITKVNGKEFGSFQEFVTLVENNTEEYVVFENEGKQQLIIPAKDAARATEDIIKRNHIPSRCSEDVSLWLKQ